MKISILRPLRFLSLIITVFTSQLVTAFAAEVHDCLQIKSDHYEAFGPISIYFWDFHTSDDAAHVKAAEICGAAAQKDPNNFEIQYRLGSALVLIGKSSEAEKHLRAAYEGGITRAGYLLGMLGMLGMLGILGKSEASDDEGSDASADLLKKAWKDGTFEAAYALARVYAGLSGKEGDARRFLPYAFGWFCRAGAFEDSRKDIWRKVWQNIGINLAAIGRELTPDEKAFVKANVPECGDVWPLLDR